MTPSRFCRPIVFASLALAWGCSRVPPRSASPQALESEYVTVIPEVTYSRTGQDVAPEDAEVSADDDVMASILSIPPGGPSRHAPCTECLAEDRQ
jgi:hypothetical protein